MGEAMLRTTYSQILNSSRDFSIALCDSQARLVAQADATQLATIIALNRHLVPLPAAGPGTQLNYQWQR